jgi:hypothetical protein
VGVFIEKADYRTAIVEGTAGIDNPTKVVTKVGLKSNTGADQHGGRLNGNLNSEYRYEQKTLCPNSRLYRLHNAAVCLRGHDSRRDHARGPNEWPDLDARHAGPALYSYARSKCRWIARWDTGDRTDRIFPCQSHDPIQSTQFNSDEYFS